jgi:hypothetical protein
MTLNTAGYTLGTNEPLNHARILYAPLVGTVAADGTNGDLATNDYTAQRWTLAAGANDWVLTAASASGVDTVFIAAHNLTGATVTISTSPDLATAYTLRATIVVADNSTIAAMFTDGSGNAITTRRIKVSVDEGDGLNMGIIRAGPAMQMTQPFFGGFAPTTLNRVTEGQQSFSETGQWVGRTEKRRAFTGSYSWTHLRAAWYRSTFESFAKTLPAAPFGIIGNPTKMPEDVVWAWCQKDPSPSNMGVIDFMQVGFDVTGYAG